MKLPKIVWHPADKYFLFTALLSLYIIPNLLAEPTVPSYVTNSLLIYQLGWIPLYSLGRSLDSYESEATQLFFIGVILFVTATAVYGMGIENWFPSLSLVLFGFPAVFVFIYRKHFSPRAKEQQKKSKQEQADRQREAYLRTQYADLIARLPEDDPVATLNNKIEAMSIPEPLRPRIVPVIFEEYQGHYPVYKGNVEALIASGISPETFKEMLETTLININPATLPQVMSGRYSHKTSIDNVGRVMNILTQLLPPEHFITEPRVGSRTWEDYVNTYLQSSKTDKEHEKRTQVLEFIGTLPSTIKETVYNTPITTAIPEYHGHTHICAGTGWGKTQLIQSKLVDDIRGNDAIVVIDSQERMIQNIAKVATIPEERLVYIDPTDLDNPPALSLFSFAGKNAHDPLQREQAVASALEMYEYIFSAFDAQMTSKQATAYRYLARLMFDIPGANIHTLREMLEPGAVIPTEKLSPTARSFFQNEYNSKEFADTRKQVLRRLYTLLENQVFEQMFSATESKLDIKKELDRGAIILVNTAKSLLRENGSAIFGRFWIGQITQAVFQNSKRTKVYIDEFHEYASESYLNVLLEQGRKYSLELTVAHQALAQLNPKMVAALASNTTAQYVGGVNASDARALSSIMRTDADTIMEQPKGSFMVHVQDVGTIPYQVPLGVMEALPQRQSIQSVREEMRRRYSSPQTKPDEQLSSKPIQSEDKLTKW